MRSQVSLDPTIGERRCQLAPGSSFQLPLLLFGFAEGPLRILPLALPPFL